MNRDINFENFFHDINCIFGCAISIGYSVKNKNPGSGSVPGQLRVPADPGTAQKGRLESES
jgi:hypothetical protein